MGRKDDNGGRVSQHLLGLNIGNTLGHLGGMYEYRLEQRTDKRAGGHEDLNGGERPQCHQGKFDRGRPWLDESARARRDRRIARYMVAMIGGDRREIRWAHGASSRKTSGAAGAGGKAISPFNGNYAAIMTSLHAVPRKGQFCSLNGNNQPSSGVC